MDSNIKSPLEDKHVTTGT